jgi:hypothetical protein
MRRLVALALILLLTCAAAAARQSVNYQIREVGYQLSDGQVEVTFTVINGGEAVNAAEPVYLFDNDGNELASASIPPLVAGGKTPRQELAVPLDQFPAGSRQTFYIVVGSDELPPANQRSQLSNVTVPIPDTIVGAAPTPAAPGGVVLPGGFPVDLRNPSTVAALLGIIIIVALLLWVITVILRLLFSRPPALPAWQPPYVITPLIDPNSTNGRRQLWQQHAESDTLPLPCVPGNYMVRKILIGSGGAKLAGWRVTGLRISQYDRYGRVARSQTVLPKKTVKALDRAVRKSTSLDWDRAMKAVRPVAKALTAAYQKKAKKQSATLPVAVDIRFVGMHGEVRILFELYGCNGNTWHEIDHWEPEMRVVNGSIHENFTYTLLGQYPEETYKQFRKRFALDVNRALAALVQAPPPPPVPEDTSETAALAK